GSIPITRSNFTWCSLMTIDMSVWELYKQSVEPLNKKNRADPNLDKPKIHIQVTVRHSNHAQFVQPRPHLKVHETTSSDFKKRTIEATIDLHGYTCQQAENQLVHFFHRAQQRHLKTVLVITGKGRSDSNDDPASQNSFGVLRQLALQWFTENPQFVVSFSVAAQHHGGLGAFYVHVRRMV
ncbi:MAG: Smr/MutS family protein, partial [Alphaproteobacteria bacterium]|nr:Smr/MutS family protein [Alphaproteobacteria bacterium]